ncbi:antibiotic biosynthesis monooxygenase [Arthrobacter sp. FW306-06-A]|uniref:antibiotic biosynthesis monooxygenase n=1 Tax=Arthrobacter sp. FW306-06-A TaxID=2879621 RepID=UPI001F337645|nr:antibiotic biosynthesis monooxygenase [Arthrobacter sp. FW306-06-A]UKA72899.1 antibiotic biosynthesis monooxygenase [Arthrobacter sp. FW306-06-A]
MPVIASTEVTGLSRDQCFQVAAALTDKLKAAPGFMGHCAYENQGVINVVEVWASAEDHDAWFDGSVRPNLWPGVTPQKFDVMNLVLPDSQ